MNPETLLEIKAHLLAALTLIGENMGAKDIPVDTLNFSPRVRFVCDELNIKSLGGFCELEAYEILRVANAGQGTLTEIKTVLAHHGLSLRKED